MEEVDFKSGFKKHARKWKQDELQKTTAKLIQAKSELERKREVLKSYQISMDGYRNQIRYLKKKIDEQKIFKQDVLSFIESMKGGNQNG